MAQIGLQRSLLMQEYVALGLTGAVILDLLREELPGRDPPVYAMP